MSDLHKKEEIEKIEEGWQKRFYIQSGNGIHYIHVCEICHRTVPKRIPGGHYVCTPCLKKLRLPKEETIICWGKGQIRTAKELGNEKHHPSEPSKRDRAKAWKKVIKEDYLIDLFNKHFKYKY